MAQQLKNYAFRQFELRELMIIRVTAFSEAEAWRSFRRVVDPSQLDNWYLIDDDIPPVNAPWSFRWPWSQA